MIAEHLSVEEVAGIKEAFDMMDVEKKGKIHLEELRTGLQKIGHQIPDSDLQILMEAVCTFPRFVLLSYPSVRYIEFAIFLLSWSCIISQLVKV